MQAFTEAMFSDTVDSLYRAVTDESHWAAALAKVSQAFDSPRAAAMLSAELRRADFAKGLSLEALNALDWPVFAVDSAGTVLLANQPGERALVRRSPFALKGQKMFAADPEIDVRFRSALATSSNARGAAFFLQDGPGQGLLACSHRAHRRLHRCLARLRQRGR